MKHLILSFLILYVTCGKCLSQERVPQRMVLDSLEVLKSVGGLVDGYSHPPTAEETRYYNILKMLFSLPYSEAKKLLSDKNVYARVYGFIVATKLYLDSLTPAELEVFKDSTIIYYYTQRGNIDLGLNAGQYCEMAYASELDAIDSRRKEKSVVSSVENFIRTNARYPDSYMSRGFSKYLWGGENADRYFEIQHSYILKTQDGQLSEELQYFILDHKLKVVLVETVRSKTIWSDESSLSEWRLKFGKKR